MNEDNRIVTCDCDWSGIVEMLINGELCPRCRNSDVEINDMSFGFSDEGDYSYKIEDLAHVEREINKHYNGQFVNWEEDRLLIPDDDIVLEGLERNLSFYLLDKIADDSREQVDMIINNLVKGV
jgi:hypothetical protein